MLTQGKDDNEAGRKKDKQETANPGDREYKYRSCSQYNTYPDVVPEYLLFYLLQVVLDYNAFLC